MTFRTARRATFCVIAVVLVAVIAASCCSSTGEARPTPTPKPTPAPTRFPEATVPATTRTALPVPAYTTEVDDVSVARAVRFAVTVVIEFPVSVEQIESVCQEVVLKLKEQKPFNAAVVFLFDTRSLLSAGYSIAKCEYAPRGDWAEAANVLAGDYSTHEFVYEYQDKVHEPEQALSARPSEEEHKLAQEWDELTFKLIQEGEDPVAVEDIGFERVAQSHGMDVQLVRDAVWKVTFWTSR